MRALILPALLCVACGAKGPREERYAIPLEVRPNSVHVVAADPGANLVALGRGLKTPGVVVIDRRTKKVSFDEARWLITTDAPLVQGDDGVIETLETGRTLRFADAGLAVDATYRFTGVQLVRVLSGETESIVEAVDERGQTWTSRVALPDGARVDAVAASEAAKSVALLVEGYGALAGSAYLVFLDLTTGREERRLELHSAVGDVLAFSEDGASMLLVVGGDKPRLALIDARSGQVRAAGTGAFPRLPSRSGGSRMHVAQDRFWIFEFWEYPTPSHPGPSGLGPRDGLPETGCHLVAGTVDGSTLRIGDRDSADLAKDLRSGDWRTNCRLRGALASPAGGALAVIVGDADVTLRPFQLTP